jgi:hypothetical protein
MTATTTPAPATPTGTITIEPVQRYNDEGRPTFKTYAAWIMSAGRDKVSCGHFKHRTRSEAQQCGEAVLAELPAVVEPEPADEPAAEVPARISGPIIDALEGMWAAIRRNHPEVPEVVIVMASGRERASLKWGHFARFAWKRGEGHLSEVFVGGEGFERGVVPTLGTLIHEASHAVADVRKVQDTSRGGRYHNKRFASIARELGIEVEQTGTIGWSKTSVPDATAAKYADELATLEAALTVFRAGSIAAEMAPGKTRTSNNNGNSCVCMCEPPRRIRVSAATLEEAPIVCGACDEPFEPALG